MKSAIQLIREVDRGQLLHDFEDALDRIVEAVERHGGKGSITIKLSLSRKSDAYEVKGDLKYDVPQPPRLGAIFFFDAGAGELTRQDPRQPDLPAIVEADFTNTRKDNGNE